MSIDTKCRLKGYVSPAEITDYIRTHWDPNATDTSIRKNIYGPLSEITFPYKLNPNSGDKERWSDISGFISFSYHGERRNLFYHYSNINSLENLDYYREHQLEDMVQSETTNLILGWKESSVVIMKELLTAFSGGWLDEDDCDDYPYYYVAPKQKGFHIKETNSMNNLFDKSITFGELFRAIESSSLSESEKKQFIKLATAIPTPPPAIETESLDTNGKYAVRVSETYTRTVIVDNAKDYSAAEDIVEDAYNQGTLSFYENNSCVELFMEDDTKNYLEMFGKEGFEDLEVSEEFRLNSPKIIH